MPKMIFRCNYCGKVFTSCDEADRCEKGHTKKCANPKCNKEFVNYSTRGKIYCCTACKNIVRQQRFRDRQKALSEESNHAEG